MPSKKDLKMCISTDYRTQQTSELLPAKRTGIISCFDPLKDGGLKIKSYAQQDHCNGCIRIIRKTK